MQSTNSEAQITQSGQAITLNNQTFQTLKSLFSVCLGPNGTYKAIITPGHKLTITKNGSALCRDIQFINPTSLVITRAAGSLYTTFGDGSTTFITLCSDLFTNSFNYFCDGVSIPKICNGLQACLSDICRYIESLAIEFKDVEQMQNLAFNLLKTKISTQNSKILAPILVKAVENISKSQFQDVNMVEVMKMNEGDVNDTRYIDGLVLDHGNRHYGMPTVLNNVVVFITNISLEYEKPEVNAQFTYSSSKQREELAETEREFILRKAEMIGAFADQIKKDTEKSFLLISEKGIDPYSLEILAKHNILALRRAKRRNLERLLYMCGGNIISEVSQFDIKNLGVCEKVKVVSFDDEKYTFMEGTPHKGSCTVLVRADTENEMDKMVNCVKGTLKVLHNTAKEKKIIPGGIDLYRKLVNYITFRLQEVPEPNVVGFEIVKQSFTNMIKVLLRNKGANVHEVLVQTLRNKDKSDVVYDNFGVVSGVINNSIVVCMSLLMVDEIIKAGKCIKDDKPN